MEDVLTEQPPPSRFFLEDLNNFAPPSPPLPSPLLIFSKNPNPNPDLRRSLLIIAISPPSLSLFHHLPKTLIGTLILPEIPLSGNCIRPSLRDRSSHVFSLHRSPSTLLVSVQYSVPADRSYVVARSLLTEIRPETVVVFDSIQSRNFRGKLPIDETFAFKLETSKQRAADPTVRGLEYFPSGSVIDGLAAAVLARCQIEKIKGTLCVSWPESGNSAVVLVRCLMKDVLPDLEIVCDSGSDQIRDGRIDSELYT